jgi:hypothetical protein
MMGNMSELFTKIISKEELQRQGVVSPDVADAFQ